MPLKALEGPGLKAEFGGYKKLELLVVSGAAASVMPERLLEDYFVRALDVSDQAVLREAAVTVGLPGDEVDRVQHAFPPPPFCPPPLPPLIMCLL